MRDKLLVVYTPWKKRRSWFWPYQNLSQVEILIETPEKEKPRGNGALKGEKR